MPRYADGFVIPVHKSKLKAYMALSKKAGKIWKEYGAIEYCECVGDDVNVKFGLPFPKLARLKAGEVPVFSWIVYKSRKHRDGVNAKVMKDERMNAAMGKEMPFELKRMSCGGFKILVDL